MRAIVDINGKQYEVEEGRYVQIDRYPAQENEAVTLSNVRLVVAGDKSVIGQPYIDGATVKTTVKRHSKGPKILVYKMRCKKGYRRKNGHRQDFTELQVELVDFPGRDQFPAAPKAYQAPPRPEKTKPVKEEPAKKAPKAQVKEQPVAAEAAVEEVKAAVVDTPEAPEVTTEAKPKAKKATGEAKPAKKADGEKAPAKKKSPAKPKAKAEGTDAEKPKAPKKSPKAEDKQPETGDNTPQE